MTTANKMTECVLVWDEPEGCTSPRGWVHLENHPERHEYTCCTCCGNYLDYEGCYSRGPNGETVHWVAYIKVAHTVTRLWQDIRLGYGWARTVEEAKAVIEGNIRAYFGLPRE